MSGLPTVNRWIVLGNPSDEKWVKLGEREAKTADEAMSEFPNAVAAFCPYNMRKSK